MVRSAREMFASKTPSGAVGSGSSILSFPTGSSFAVADNDIDQVGYEITPNIVTDLNPATCRDFMYDPFDIPGDVASWHTPGNLRIKPGGDDRPDDRDSVGKRDRCETCLGKDAAVHYLVFRSIENNADAVVLDPLWSCR